MKGAPGWDGVPGWCGTRAAYVRIMESWIQVGIEAVVKYASTERACDVVMKTLGALDAKDAKKTRSPVVAPQASGNVIVLFPMRKPGGSTG